MNKTDEILGLGHLHSSGGDKPWRGKQRSSQTVKPARKTRLSVWKCREWRVEECLKGVREDHSEERTHELRPEWWEGEAGEDEGRQFHTKVMAIAIPWGGKEKRAVGLANLDWEQWRRSGRGWMDVHKNTSGPDYIALLYLTWSYFLLIQLSLHCVLWHLFYCHCELVFVFLLIFNISCLYVLSSQLCTIS